MKIFLLNADPPFFQKGYALRRNRIWPPITLAIIAQGLEYAGHDIRLVDANARHMKDKEVIKAIGQFRPDLFIFSSDRHDAWQLPVPSHEYIRQFFDTYTWAGAVADTVAMIGPHGTLFPEEILKTIPSIDYVIQGEPEQKTLDFVKALDQGEPRSAGGICFLSSNGELRSNPDPGFVEDLDSLPLPAYHLLPMDLYRDNTAPDRKFGVVPTSRGCPMKCIFCSKTMYGSKFRTRSIENVLSELDLLVRQYGVGRIFFHDQLFLFKRKRIETLLQAMIDCRYDITWRCQTRIFSLDREILELMKRAGCTEAHVGLESTAPSVQKALNKSDADIDKFREVHALGRELGISISPNMIIGLPNETYDTVMESARFYNSMG
ncbi:MAG: radical SAM protein, partial [Planctomycetota bacterium]